MDTVGQWMANYLEQREIRALFTLTGGHVFPLLDGCLDARVRVVDTRHEQAAAFAAEGYALRTGRPGAYLVTAGPGFANAVSGLAHASVTLAPTLCISGASPVAEDDRGALQELEQLRVAEVYARYAKTVRDTNRIPQYLEMAFQSMLGPTPGPAFLEIPQDVFYKPLAADAPTGFGPRPTPRAAGDPRDIERAAAMLRQAERPVVVVGGGGFWSGAAEALASFAEQTGLPIFTRNAARGLLPDSHPQCYGGSPGLGVFKADLVLVIGSRFNATFYFGDSAPEAASSRSTAMPPRWATTGASISASVETRAWSSSSSRLPSTAIAFPPTGSPHWTGPSPGAPRSSRPATGRAPPPSTPCACCTRSTSSPTGTPR